MRMKQVHTIKCNESTFKLPGYQYEMLKVTTTCPETGKKVCMSALAGQESVDVPEQGCLVEFLKANGTQAEQSIQLVREDADAVAEKIRANAEATLASKEAQEALAMDKELENEFKLDSDVEVTIETPTTAEELAETISETVSDEYLKQNGDVCNDDEEVCNCTDDECVDMSCEDMMETKASIEDEEDCAEQECDDEECGDYDEDGEYEYPTED
jgi:hypothetical protein